MVIPFFLNRIPRSRSSTSANEATKAQRFLAIRICYFGMFVSSIVFSITVSSLWPFLQIVFEFIFNSRYSLIIY
jgi:hypothetical protein